MMKRFILLLVFVFSANLVISQNQFWQEQTNYKVSDLKYSKENLPRVNTYTLNLQAIQQELNNAPVRGESINPSNVIIPFPNGEGYFDNFRIMEASVMHPELQNR